MYNYDNTDINKYVNKSIEKWQNSSYKKKKYQQFIDSYNSLLRQHTDVALPENLFFRMRKIHKIIESIPNFKKDHLLYFFYIFSLYFLERRHFQSIVNEINLFQKQFKIYGIFRSIFYGFKRHLKDIIHSHQKILISKRTVYIINTFKYREHWNTYSEIENIIKEFNNINITVQSFKEFYRSEIIEVPEVFCFFIGHGTDDNRIELDFNESYLTMDDLPGIISRKFTGNINLTLVSCKSNNMKINFNNYKNITAIVKHDNFFDLNSSAEFFLTTFFYDLQFTNIFIRLYKNAKQAAFIFDNEMNNLKFIKNPSHKLYPHKQVMTI